MSAYQISEGRATRSIAVDIGLTIGQTWQNTDIDYDVAIGGIPFLIAPTQDHPYQRDTTQFRKNQYDTQRDPCEQSLTNWWIRSQSSFQAGNGGDDESDAKDRLDKEGGFVSKREVTLINTAELHNEFPE